jgi:hypothetical protein
MVAVRYKFAACNLLAVYATHLRRNGIPRRSTRRDLALSPLVLKVAAWTTSQPPMAEQAAKTAQAVR